MRENRTYGSEGGGTGNSTGSPYPYRCSVIHCRLDIIANSRDAVNS